MLNELAQQLHQECKERGFWATEQDPARILMLIVSEASEALEEIRDGHDLSSPRTVYHSTPESGYLPDITVINGRSFFYYGTSAVREVTHEDYIAAGFLAKPVGVPSEMADIIIRALDACAAWGIDIDEAIRLKREYNGKRGHMNGGKRF